MLKQKNLHKKFPTNGEPVAQILYNVHDILFRSYKRKIYQKYKTIQEYIFFLIYRVSNQKGAM